MQAFVSGRQYEGISTVSEDKGADDEELLAELCCSLGAIVTLEGMLSFWMV